MTQAQQTYVQIASAFQAALNCGESSNDVWFDRHVQTIEEICRNHAPHGSGFDSGTTFDFNASKPERLVFNTSYHHMNEGGYYDGWTEHQVVVTPSLLFGYHLKVTGRNRNDIKDYIGGCFASFLDVRLENIKAA